MTTYSTITKKYLINHRNVVIENLLSAPIAENGKDWYADQRKELLKLSAEFGFSLEAIAKATSHLSPSQRWATNLRAIRQLCKICRPNIFSLETQHKIALSAGIPAFKTGVTKAVDALNGKPTKFGPKTESFWKNLVGCPNAVTVDRHHIGLMLNVGKGDHRITDGAYNLAVEITVEVADSLNMSPAAFQAAIWTARTA